MKLSIKKLFSQKATIGNSSRLNVADPVEKLDRIEREARMRERAAACGIPFGNFVFGNQINR